MRFKLFTALAAGIWLTACGGEKSPETPDKTVVTEVAETTKSESQHPVSLHKLTDGVWYHKTDYTFPDGGKVPSNGLLVEDGDGLILVDTAWGEQATKDLLRLIKKEIGKPVTKLIITHHHYDRLAGVDILESEGVAVFTHPDTPRRSMALGTPTPDRAVPALTDKGSRVKVGVVEVAYTGPGHAEENLVVFVPEANILFGGCMIRGKNFKTMGNTNDADLNAWPDSLAWTKNTFARTAIIVPGHGKPDTIGLIDHTLELLKANPG